MNDFFQLGVHVRATDTGEMDAAIFAPYWIVNRTGESDNENDNQDDNENDNVIDDENGNG